MAVQILAVLPVPCVHPMQPLFPRFGPSLWMCAALDPGKNNAKAEACRYIPVDLDEDVQARLEVLESHHHLVPPRHDEGEVEDDSVHRDAFVDEDGLDLGLVQELSGFGGRGVMELTNQTQRRQKKRKTAAYVTQQVHQSTAGSCDHTFRLRSENNLSLIHI